MATQLLKDIPIKTTRVVIANSSGGFDVEHVLTAQPNNFAVGKPDAPVLSTDNDNNALLIKGNISAYGNDIEIGCATGGNSVVKIFGGSGNTIADGQIIIGGDTRNTPTSVKINALNGGSIDIKNVLSADSNGFAVGRLAKPVLSTDNDENEITVNGIVNVKTGFNAHGSFTVDAESDGSIAIENLLTVNSDSVVVGKTATPLFSGDVRTSDIKIGVDENDTAAISVDQSIHSVSIGYHDTTEGAVYIDGGSASGGAFIGTRHKTANVVVSADNSRFSANDVIRINGQTSASFSGGTVQIYSSKSDGTVQIGSRDNFGNINIGNHTGDSGDVIVLSGKSITIDDAVAINSNSINIGRKSDDSSVTPYTNIVGNMYFDSAMVIDNSGIVHCKCIRVYNVADNMYKELDFNSIAGDSTGGCFPTVPVSTTTDQDSSN